MNKAKEEQAGTEAAAEKEAKDHIKDDAAVKDTSGSKKYTPAAAAAEEIKQDKGKESELLVKFSIEVTNEEIEKSFEQTAANYARDVKIPGFRKGKVPIEVVKSRYKDALNDEVINKAIEKAVFDRIDKEKMKIAASPVVEKIDHKEGENLKADITVEVFPEVNLPDLEKIEIEVPAKDLKLEEYDEEKQIDAFLEANRRRVPVSGRAIKEKDYVKIKYQSKLLDTKRMTPKKEAEYPVNKEGEFEILDLYKELIGKKLKDKLTVKNKYPENYKKKIWAGKEIEHYIEIEAIFELVKPELDNELLQSMGFKDVASFKTQLKADYDQYEKNHRENKISQLIADKINEVIEFPVPPTLIDQEAARMLNYRSGGQLNFKDEKQAREFLAPFKVQAEKSIKFSLIVTAVKDEFKIEVASDDLEQEYKRIADKNNIPLKEVRKYYLNSKKDLQALKESLHKVKVMEFLKEKVKIKEV